MTPDHLAAILAVAEAAKKYRRVSETEPLHGGYVDAWLALGDALDRLKEVEKNDV